MAGKKAAAFAQPAVLAVARSAIGKGMCDHCLGRQLAHVSTGMTNQERGILLRRLLKEPDRTGSCPICGDVFSRLGDYARQAQKAVEGVEFSTFVVGTRLSPQLVQREEELWEDLGIEYCEPLKSELNRELGKLLQAALGKEADEQRPQVLFTLDLEHGEVLAEIRPLFVAGAYRKLVRGLPQTKWDMYKETVEDIIARPLMRVSQATAHALHGAGREDIDARCLDWRPFVLELSSPKKRSLPLRLLERRVNTSRKVKVRGLRFSDKKEVIRVKAMRLDKSYRALVTFERQVSQRELASLRTLVGVIQQKTPTRVLHRRADLLRKRRLKSIRARLLGKRRAVIEVRGEAGLYIKELITGDGGRTAPSVAALLGPAVVKELDVIKIHRQGR